MQDQEFGSGGHDAPRVMSCPEGAGGQRAETRPAAGRVSEGGPMQDQEFGSGGHDASRVVSGREGVGGRETASEEATHFGADESSASAPEGEGASCRMGSAV